MQRCQSRPEGCYHTCFCRRNRYPCKNRSECNRSVPCSCKGYCESLFAAGMPEITTCKAAGNTVLLTWNKYENADSYIILRRKMGESKFAKIATVKDLSYTDTAVSPSTPYYYSVYLSEYNMTTEIAPTERCAYFRLLSPKRPMLMW